MKPLPSAEASLVPPSLPAQSGAVAAEPPRSPETSRTPGDKCRRQLLRGGRSLRLLDLFCCAGGAGEGYRRAGFDVTGIDIEPQPNNPHYFIQADALEYLAQHGDEFDAIHASPPCQGYSNLRAMHPGKEYPLLIDPVREMLMAFGKPYVIENVESAPLQGYSDLFGGHGVMLCGSMFGLGVERGFLRRHRIFETSFSLPQPQCRHRGPAVGVYGHGGHTGKHRMLYREEAARAMGIDWMNRDEMCQAIPPAYTHFIGTHLLAATRVGGGDGGFETKLHAQSGGRRGCLSEWEARGNARRVSDPSQPDT